MYRATEMKKYIWTIILLSVLTSLDIHGQMPSIYYKTKTVNCKATISQVNLDTVYVITQDTCTHPIFDTIFDGVYVFKKTPSNKTTAIRTFKNKKFHGQQIEYYESGRILEQGFNIKNNKHGKWTSYYLTGEISYVVYYKNGKQKSRKNFDLNGKEISEPEHYQLISEMYLKE